eukprot:g2317.t1
MCSRSMEIPALRFTVKPRPASCRKGNASKGRWRVQQMQEALGSVGKVIRALQEGDAVWVDYPDVEDELHQGDECWILPRLHETDACRSLGIFQEETFGLVALKLGDRWASEEWAREKLKACLDCLDAKRKHKKKTKKPCPPTVDENEETVSVANTEDFEDRPNLHPSLQELKLLHAALRDEPSTDASSGDALGDELRSEPSERSSQYVEDFDICPAF